jgi:hypothetical protein
VLLGIGALVRYAKQPAPGGRKAAAHAAFRLLPVLSGVLIECVGVPMACVSLGWIHPRPAGGTSGDAAAR